MILTVTLNAALDITYRLPSVTWRGTNRMASLWQRAGGKGINVARLLAALDEDVLVTGFAGGVTGDLLRHDLAEAALPEALVPVGGQTRRTVTLVEDATGDATLFNEPGPAVDQAEWQAFLRVFSDRLPTARAVVLAGSLPAGLPSAAYATLARLSANAGVPVVLDADGDALLGGLDGRPTIVKPNRDELVRATGETDPAAGADLLRARGAAAVAASLGPDGLLAATPAGTWRARTATRLAGNPTGAGDAAVAGLVHGLVQGQPWTRRLAEAVALSAAAVLSPVAGDVDVATYRELLAAVEIREVTEERNDP